MPSLVTPSNGELATAESIAQLTEMLSGVRNIPASLTGINDASNYALALKNAGTGSRGLIIYAADGTTVLLQVDSTGVKASSAGGAAAAVATQAGTETLTNKTLTNPTLTNPIANRYKAAGTPLANGDFALSAGWGSTATATAGVGSDARGIVVVTAGGAGIAGNPTITLTFKDGTWTTAPIVLCQLTGGTGIGTAVAIGITPSTTTVIFQPFFTPISGNTYNFSWIAMGGPT